MSTRNDYIPVNDRDLDAWFANFVTVATASHTVLGLTTQDITDLTYAQTTFDGALTSHDSAMIASRSATEYKDTTRATSTHLFRQVVAKIQANPNVPDSLRTSLQITVRKSPVRRPPVTPTDLVSSLMTDGQSARLKWKAAGAAYPTNYFIECKIGNGEWTQALVTTKLSAKVPISSTDPISFRVFAERIGQRSAYSQVTTVFASLPAPALQLAA